MATASGQLKLFGWLAILAAVLFASLVTLQVIELMHYSADPTVWPALP